MAGHSKWANIQHRKGKQDAARGKAFTKLVREISVATRAGGTDPATNPRLRLAMDRAFAASMPKDNIERAIKKSSGEIEGAAYEELRYEGYAPGGIAVLVDCLTDNRMRTVADVRYAFNKMGGNLGTDGSVAFMFKLCGLISYAPGADENKITEIAIESGADDIIVHPQDGSIEVLCAPDQFSALKAALENAKLNPDQAEVSMRPESLISVSGETAQQVVKLLDRLEELDDVQHVYCNADLDQDAYQ